MLWINRKYIDPLVKLDKDSYTERLGCGNAKCKKWIIDGFTTACGKGLDVVSSGRYRLGKELFEIIDPCLICANLHRKSLKARGGTHIKFLPMDPSDISDAVSGL